MVGDLRNNLEKLKTELRSIKYPHQLEEAQVEAGIPVVYLPIFHYVLLMYSTEIANFITEKGFELYAKNDMRFMESLNKLFVTHFNYKSALTTTQFFQNGFAERKLILACDVISLIKSKHLLLNNLNPGVKKSVNQVLKKEKSKPELK